MNIPEIDRLRERVVLEAINLLAARQQDLVGLGDDDPDEDYLSFCSEQLDIAVADLARAQEEVEPRHRIDYVWQERPGELSWSCTCGLVSKHQGFGQVPPCPDREIRVLSQGGSPKPGGYADAERAMDEAFPPDGKTR